MASSISYTIDLNYDCRQRKKFKEYRLLNSQPLWGYDARHEIDRTGNTDIVLASALNLRREADFAAMFATMAVPRGFQPLDAIGRR